MPIYPYRCRQCGNVTDEFCSVADVPEAVECASCQSTQTHRVIGRTAYHASDATKTSKLDPKYEKMVDASMRKSASADPEHLLKKMRPFSDAKKP
jgi:putative FmdB family regulatory protein